MITPNYDTSKTLVTNVQTLFTFVNWLYREMLHGRVKSNTDRNEVNGQNLILAEQNCTELDLQNIITEQSLTDLDLRVLELEARQ